MRYRRLHQPVAVLVALGLMGGSASAAEPKRDAETVRHFETHIRPLLVEKCLSCHGPEKQRGDLRLDSAEGFQNGGGSGDPLFNRDQPEESLFLRALRHDDGVEKMPPKEKLKPSEIAAFTKWVRSGAYFPPPAKVVTDPREKHWAFQPLVRPAVPAVKNRRGITSDLDHFVWAKLEAAGLRPAAPADRRTLIRRATLDLTGLPPTPEEIDAFLKDKSPTAFATVVDRLLASPAYGERWGRHWLDVARYADSNGLDENIAHGNAWRYRDYVIQSFNEDKPYDHFLREQVAGDLLPAEDHAQRIENLVATGFLSLGPKVLAEPDPKKMELDIVDEQVDTLGRTVMGLTLGCARCHDHKFDPISSADYYGLAGLFVSTKTMENFKIVARWHENPLGTPEENARKTKHDDAVAKLKQQIKELNAKKKKDAASKEAVKKLQAELAGMEKSAPEVPSAMGVTDGTPMDIPVLRRGDYLTPAAIVARRFPIVLAGAEQSALPADHSGRLQLADWLTDPKHPLTSRVIVNRVWRWHFGKGLVRSADNFGLLGDAPTHPELLDWLATEFIRDGWSFKTLHRRIMLSGTYQMGSAHDAKAAAVDSDNLLLWRFQSRRLEAEAIRDSLLAVSGLLDRTAGGPVLGTLKNRAFVFDHTSKDQTTYATNRRSVYLPIIRNNLYDVFQLFDAPDAAVANGDRATTTVPTQALFFMNSELAVRAAGALADRVFKQTASDESRVARLFTLAYGRKPTSEDVARVRTQVAAFESKFAAEADGEARSRKAWTVVSQAILASNEFVYIP